MTHPHLHPTRERARTYASGVLVCYDKCLKWAATHRAWRRRRISTNARWHLDPLWGGGRGGGWGRWKLNVALWTSTLSCRVALWPQSKHAVRNRGALRWVVRCHPSAARGGPLTGGQRGRGAKEEGGVLCLCSTEMKINTFKKNNNLDLARQTPHLLNLDRVSKKKTNKPKKCCLTNYSRAEIKNKKRWNFSLIFHIIIIVVIIITKLFWVIIVIEGVI